jgi:hypothetical protein
MIAFPNILVKSFLKLKINLKILDSLVIPNL